MGVMFIALARMPYTRASIGGTNGFKVVRMPTLTIASEKRRV